MLNEAMGNQFFQQQHGLPPVDNTGLLPPKDITLGRGTGGVDDDRLPGDEALQLVVVPRDEDGNPVRIVGTLYVTVWEITPSGVKIPLSSWEVNSLDLRRTWRSGLLGSGYFVLLPWKKWPTQERLRVAVQLGLADGRLYEADKDISIRPPKATVEEKMPLLGPRPGIEERTSPLPPKLPVEERMPLLPAAPAPPELPDVPPPAFVPESGPAMPAVPAWMLVPRPSIYLPQSQQSPAP
jgi:hypothetical protein